MKKMTKLVKGSLALAAAALLALPMALAVPQKALAKEEEDDAEVISSVSLNIEADISAGEDGCEVEVTTDDSEYEVDYVEIKNEPRDRWQDGDKPKLKITLTTDEEDYIFESGFSKKDVELSGDEATVTSVSRKKDKLTIHVTLEELEGDGDDGYDLEVYDLMWDKSDGSASWDGGDDTETFEVRILRDGSALSTSLTANYPLYSFAPYFTGSGRYTFKVRGVYDASHKGDWEESEPWEVSAEMAAAVNSAASADAMAGVWIRDGKGWWYRNPDGSYTVNNWQLIENQRYFFGETGYMKTGWILWNGQWYYCGADGAMLSGTATPDGYYVGSDGVWIP